MGELLLSAAAGALGFFLAHALVRWAGLRARRAALLPIEPRRTAELRIRDRAMIARFLRMLARWPKTLRAAWGGA